MSVKQFYHFVKTPSEESFELTKKGQLYERDVMKKVDKDEFVPSKIIKYALKNERAARIMETNNTLTFIVDVRATKPEIKKAVAEMYGAPVARVNTLITFKHYTKKAFVRFKDEGAAVDIASRAGII